MYQVIRKESFLKKGKVNFRKDLLWEHRLIGTYETRERALFILKKAQKQIWSKRLEKGIRPILKFEIRKITEPKKGV